ncbi:alanine racemase [Bradyrhizobium sp. USDA 4463]
MSRGPWKPNPTKEAMRLIAAVEAMGYAVTSVEVAHGVVRLGVRCATVEALEVNEAEELRNNL